MPSKSTLKEYGSSVGFTLKILDASAITLAGIISYLWRFDGRYTESLFPIENTYLVSFVLSVLILEIVFTMLGAHQNWKNSSVTMEFKYTLLGISITFATLLVIAFFTHTFTFLPRTWIASWFILSVLFITGFRLLLRGYYKVSVKRGAHVERILIVGNGRLGKQVAERLLNMPTSGLLPVGFLSNQKSDHGAIKTLGNITQLKSIIEQYSINQVWIALPMSEADTMAKVQNELSTTLVTIRMVPDIYGFHLINHSVSDIAGMPVISLSSSPMLERKNRIAKRLEDIILSSIILVLISPIMIALALAVKLTSPGPVFYRQERVSWNGMSFNMLKFRSMATDSEKNGIQWGGAAAMSVTPIGKFIRKTSIDELPQFINVLKGDMSIIGPRPERTVFVEQFKHEIPGYMQKHMVKAGISGWAQINGWRGDTDLKKRIECDLYYIENWSVWFDLKIIALTMLKGFIHKNAK